MIKTKFPKLVAKELINARSLHRNQNSLHEGYAVIKEEFDEFWDEVKRKDNHKVKTLHELVQTAAMCQRTAEDCGLLTD